MNQEINNFNINFNNDETVNVSKNSNINIEINYPSINDIFNQKDKYFNKIIQNQLTNITYLKNNNIELTQYKSAIPSLYGFLYSNTLKSKVNGYPKPKEILNFEFEIDTYPLHDNTSNVIMQKRCDCLFNKLVELINIEDVTII